MTTPNSFHAENEIDEYRWDEDANENVLVRKHTYQHHPREYDKSRESRHFLPLAEQKITCLAVGDSNQYIATGSAGNTVCIINTKSAHASDRFVRLGFDSFASYSNVDDYSSDGGSLHSDTDSRHSGDHESIGRSSTGSGSKNSSLGKSGSSSRGSVGGKTTHDAAITAVKFSHSLDNTVKDIFSADKDGKVHQFRRDHDKRTWEHFAFCKDLATRTPNPPELASASNNFCNDNNLHPQRITHL